MKKKFLFRLFLYISPIFLMMSILIYCLQTVIVHTKYQHLIQSKINYVKAELNDISTNISKIDSLRKKNMLDKCHLLAWIIKESPDILKNASERDELQKSLDIELYYLTDENGIITYSDRKKSIGFDLRLTKTSSEFMAFQNNPHFELWQDLLPRGEDNKLISLCGVSRIDKPGLIIIGMGQERVNRYKKLSSVARLVDGLRIGHSGKMYIVQNNRFVSAENKIIIDQPISLLNIPESAFNKDKGTFSYIYDDVARLAVFERYQEYRIFGDIPEYEISKAQNMGLESFIALFILSFIVIYLVIYYLIRNIIITGIKKINVAVSKITQGDLDVTVNVNSCPEFNSLSTNLNTMVVELKKEMSNRLSNIDQDLKMAQQIQHSLIPFVFPPYPEHKEFDLYGIMDSPKEVGGDFFNFLLIDDDHLCVFIADASGKGIPAAMFMLSAQTQIRNLTLSGLTPEQTFERTNNILCDNNDSKLNITSILGLLELSTGKFTYINAAHPTPCVFRATDGKTFSLSGQQKKDPMLGLKPGIKFHPMEYTFEPGDKLLLFTDGVLDAQNIHGLNYGKQRLYRLLDSGLGAKDSLKEIVCSIRNDVCQFYSGAEQFDDITMLIMAFYGPQPEQHTAPKEN